MTPEQLASQLQDVIEHGSLSDLLNMYNAAFEDTLTIDDIKEDQ